MADRTVEKLQRQIELDIRHLYRAIIPTETDSVIVGIEGHVRVTRLGPGGALSTHQFHLGLGDDADDHRHL